ncbi:MAG TPA: hypothetical protein VFP71_10080, partial [Candidatus Angelobacter sp.]|nr:hypothetical protein [Candidatus Angelobacter sp.]
LYPQNGSPQKFCSDLELTVRQKVAVVRQPDGGTAASGVAGASSAKRQPQIFWVLPRTKKQISPRMNVDDTNLQINGLIEFF